MGFLRLFYTITAFFQLGRIARADGRTLKIPARENCLLAACSLARLIESPAAWAESLVLACLIAGLLFGVDLALSGKERGAGRFPWGGGDIKLVFSLLLQTESRAIPLWGGTACVYILLTYAGWPDKQRLPLGPALAGACACVMLLMTAAGMCCIVYVSYIYRGFAKVLEHK